jgi:hypothetical protein
VCLHSRPPAATNRPLGAIGPACRWPVPTREETSASRCPPRIEQRPPLAAPRPSARYHQVTRVTRRCTMSLRTNPAGNTHPEVLPPTLTKGEARSLQSSAKRHWRAVSRNALVFAAELCRLHDGGAHLVRGYDNFAIYAEHTFDGLTANAAKQLSRQGGVLLTLEHHNRVDLEQARLPVATTALRALSVVHNTFGERTMLSVYDRATRLRPDRAIVEQTVKAAMRDLDNVAPPRPALPGLAPPDPGAGGYSEPDDSDDLDDELPSEEISELVDRLDILRRHLDDLRLNVEDPILARRELRNIEEEIGQVRAAMALAYGDDHR